VHLREMDRTEHETFKDLATNTLNIHMALNYMSGCVGLIRLAHGRAQQQEAKPRFVEK
jgi:hypothetical protein